MNVKLIDIAQVIRSKNAGPYELTLDIIFRDEDMFRRMCAAGAINKELIARIYQTPVEKVSSVIEFKPAKAIKITLERDVPSGALGDRDVYGAQQHTPLLDLEFELDG